MSLLRTIPADEPSRGIAVKRRQRGCALAAGKRGFDKHGRKPEKISVMKPLIKVRRQPAGSHNPCFDDWRRLAVKAMNPCC